MTVIGNVFNGFLGLTNQLDFKCWIKQASAHLVKYYVLKWCQQGFFFFQFAEVVKIFFFFFLIIKRFQKWIKHTSVCEKGVRAVVQLCPKAK